MFCQELDNFCSLYPNHAELARKIAHIVETERPSAIDPFYVSENLNLPVEDIEQTLDALVWCNGVDREICLRHADGNCNYWLGEAQWQLFKRCPRCDRPFEDELETCYQYVWLWKWEPDIMTYSSINHTLFLSFVEREGNKLANSLYRHTQKIGVPAYHYKRSLSATLSWADCQNYAAFNAKALVMVQTGGYMRSDQCKNELAYACLNRVPIFRIVTDTTAKVDPIGLINVNWLIKVSEVPTAGDIRKITGFDWQDMLNKTQPSDFVIPAMRHILSSKSRTELESIVIDCGLNQELSPNHSLGAVVNILTGRASSASSIRAKLVGMLAPSAP
jgi:hypothetical protein